MQYINLIAAVSILLARQTLAQGQVNFYYDKACQNYAGSDYNVGNNVVVGGPSGSQAIIWVTGGRSDNPCCGATEYACKNSQCSASDQVAIGQCKSFNNGVWAKYVCHGGCE